MRIRLILVVLLFSFIIPSHAQFIGIRIGMPAGPHPQITAPVIPHNLKDDSGNLVNDNSGNQVKA